MQTVLWQMAQHCFRAVRNVIHYAVVRDQWNKLVRGDPMAAIIVADVVRCMRRAENTRTQHWRLWQSVGHNITVLGNIGRGGRYDGDVTTVVVLNE